MILVVKIALQPTYKQLCEDGTIIMFQSIVVLWPRYSSTFWRAVVTIVEYCTEQSARPYLGTWVGARVDTNSTYKGTSWRYLAGKKKKKEKRPFS